MRKLVLFCASLFAALLLISASSAQAQNVLWVSPNGADGNVCSQTSPCLTFQGALNKGGVSQINYLASGVYGPITITGSLTIDCGTGNVGNIVSSSTSAIIINTAAAATIVLRHLALNGLGTSSAVSGIHSQSFFSGTIIVEDCMIHGYHFGVGIAFEPVSGRGLLQMSNSQVFDNVTGISVLPTSGQIASVTLNKVELVANSSDGLLMSGTSVIAGTMRDSVVGENGSSGVVAQASQVYFTVEGSSIVANLANGIQTGSAGSNLNVTASTISANGTGVNAAGGGAIVSFSNNTLNGNGSDGAFTSMISLK